MIKWLYLSTFWKRLVGYDTRTGQIHHSLQTFPVDDKYVSVKNSLK